MEYIFRAIYGIIEGIVLIRKQMVRYSFLWFRGFLKNSCNYRLVTNLLNIYLLMIKIPILQIPPS